jgi:hypothetical protein
MEGATQTFTTLFSRALEENFPERHCRIVQLRYGLVDGRYHTLDQVAERYHLTRERIRQMVAHSLRIIRMHGRRNLAQGNTTRACAALLLYVQQLFKPDEPGYLDRMIAFAQGALAHLPQQSVALPLLVSLVCPLEQESGCLRDLLERYALEAARWQGLLGETSGAEQGLQALARGEQHAQASGAKWQQEKKPAPPFTRHLSLALFQAGLSIQEIAQSRGLKRRTVAIHLSEAIEAGEDVTWERIVSRQQYERIVAAFEQVGERRIRQVKKLLGGQFSYDAIRVARAVYRRRNR